ncbi:MAG: glutamate racemase [Patescibacteria group bacterium]|nr:glutamate racemase [Patescibacteria group bacterium]
MQKPRAAQGNQQAIGVLDSGVGGLSIWREIIKKNPNESTIYIADSLNCPYGEKTSEEIYNLSKNLIKFLLKKKAKLIVLACNTITVSCLDGLRRDFPDIPIVGTVPVVKTASEKTMIGRIGVLSTRKTAGSKYQKNLINKFAKNLKVINLGTDNLVRIVENGKNDNLKISKILKQELKPFSDFKADILALGCSHFPFLKREMKKVLGSKVKILDSGGAVARQVERVLENNKSNAVYRKPSYFFYTTGNAGQFSRVANELLGQKYTKMVKSTERISL